MRLSLLFISLLAAPCFANAQYQPKVTVVATGKYFKDTTGRKISVPVDTSIRKWKEQSELNRLPYNGMPNAITQKLPPDVYMGSNGKGQDIYRSQVDNMPILKPDSSFYSPMPARPSAGPVKVVPKFPGITKPGTEWVVPKNYKGNK